MKVEEAYAILSKKIVESSVESSMGDLDSLATTEKETIVGAINEVVTSVEDIKTTENELGKKIEQVEEALENKATNGELDDLEDAFNVTTQKVTDIETSITKLEDKINNLDGSDNSGGGNVTVNQVTPSNLDFITSPNITPNITSGIRVDLNTNTITRLGAGKTLEDFYNIEPWASMKRESVEGQTMVKIPLFYYKRVAIEKEPIPQSEDNNEIGEQLIVWEDYVSAYAHSDFFVHPAFIRKGKVVPYLYFSAFEGSIYDTSASKYLLEDEQVADFDNDLLCSIPNAKPCSGLTQNLTIENARKLAENRTANSDYEWHQQDFTTVSALQLLIVIATGSYDCQASVGRGVVDLPSGTGNESVKTGQTLNMSNQCGYSGENGKSSVNFFGIENFWGNMWKFVDGINIECNRIHQAWISNDDYTSNTKANKDNAGTTISKVNGYMSKIGYDEYTDWTFLPSNTVESTVISKDYLYQNNTYGSCLFVLLGGAWDYGSLAGCFCWLLNYSSGIRSRDVGARSFCIPKKFL